MDVDNLFIKNILVDTGPMLKRFIPRSQGRATPVLKRMCHVTMILDEAK
ncbi:MAG: 50S ribosomal protein L22 [Pseudomonadota bacterium]